MLTTNLEFNFFLFNFSQAQGAFIQIISALVINLVEILFELSYHSFLIRSMIQFSLTLGIYFHFFNNLILVLYILIILCGYLKRIIILLNFHNANLQVLTIRLCLKILI